MESAIFVGELAVTLLKTVMRKKEEGAAFKQSMEDLQSTLESLAPTIKAIERFNHEPEKLQPLRMKLEEGINLVENCSNLSWLDCLCLRFSYYDDRLKKLRASILEDCSTVMQDKIQRDDKKSVKNELLSMKLQLPEPENTIETYALMLPPQNLHIEWSKDPQYWTWRSDSTGRHQEAELVVVSWLEISGWMITGRLPPNAKCEAYFVFKLTRSAFGFKNKPVEVFLRFLEDGERQSRMVYLDAQIPPPNGPKRRNDGWFEIKLGEVTAREGEDKEFEMGVYETKDLDEKGGLLVRGIEIRESDS